MAEILLSLTIIGVVAAITLPSLTGNINERTWNTQRKALYARFSQAMALMPSLNGYGTFRAASGTEGTSSYDAGEDTVTETFITDGLSKVLKINNICDNEHLTDCGLPEKITTVNGSRTLELNSINTVHNYNSALNYIYKQPNTKTAAFETANGESILAFYYQQCRGNIGDYTSQNAGERVCANFLYDLNGKKGPNAVGKDIGFITAIYPVDPIIVAPMPLSTRPPGGTNLTYGERCKKQDSESRVPNFEELLAIYYNRELLGYDIGDFTYASSTQTGNGIVCVRLGHGMVAIRSKNDAPGFLHCIKR